MTLLDRVAIIDKHLNALAEHFDAVQIVACVLEPDGKTRSYKRGSGLWYARQALCSEFITEEQAEDQAIRIAAKLNPPDVYPKPN